MKQSIEVIEYTLPDYLACYLINGDSEGLTTAEINEIDEFLKDEGVTIVSMLEDSSFRWSNDLNHVGASCSTYYAHKIIN